MGKTKYIFVTGGVASSLGKGIVSASLGKLLQSRGFKVANQKMDPYLNVNSGMLTPYEHGESYVTVDGHEADLDLGHYERFLDIHTTRNSNVTSGRIYQSVIEKERRGDFLGKTVQVIPHITNEIKQTIKRVASENYDFVITEIGGTVGDMESLPYLESVRQLRWELPNDCLNIHLTYVPYVAAAKELKTKPTQHSVKKLQELGVQPDILVLRTEHKLNVDVRKKTALFCNVRQDAVVECIDVPSIYEVPLKMREEGLDLVVLNLLGMSTDQSQDLSKWENFTTKMKNASKEVRIGIVGKYVELPDAYKSIHESLIQAATYNDRKLKLSFFQSEKINKENVADKLKGLDGIVVAPGFGQRGVEGKIIACMYARENNVPMFGIGLGMQCAVIEFARNVVGLKNADSSEIDTKVECRLFDLMQEQKSALKTDGTMRLGAYNCALKENSFARNIYGKELVSERHRHRFELNNKYKDDLEKAGMVCSGVNPESGLVEIVEIPSLKWFVGVQFHPEYNSTVLNPHPLFLDFVRASIDKK